jgi:uncharacterized protein
LQLTRKGQVLQGEEHALRLRLRLIGGRAWPADGDYVPEESQLLIEAADLEGAGPPDIELHGLRGVAPEYVDGCVRVMTVQLGSTLGFLPIEIAVGTRRAFAEVEVRPKKLDYQTHYLAMKSQLEELAQNLLVHSWQAAVERYGLAPSEDRTPAELVSLLNQLWAEVRRAFELIALDPHRDVVSEFDIADASRARQVGPESLADLVRQPSFWVEHPPDTPPLPSTRTLPSGLRVTPVRVLEDRTELSYDTPPNRVLKAGLDLVRRHVGLAIRLVHEGLPAGHFALAAEEPYTALLDELSRGLGAMMRNDFIAQAGTASSTDFAQHTLEADPRYRSMVKLLKMLTLGVSPVITGRAFTVSVREVWELFEYWTYLSLVSELIWRGWEPMDADETFKAERRGLVLDLARGAESLIRMSKGEDVVALYYQRSVKSRLSPKTGALQSRTHAMRPDVMVESRIGDIGRLAVIDAKYRLDVDGVGPPQSAIDDVHVYRDGIGRYEPRPDGSYAFLPALDIGIVAFPGPDPEAFAGSRYEDSLRHGIGAVCCLPGMEGAKLIADVCKL